MVQVQPTPVEGEVSERLRITNELLGLILVALVLVALLTAARLQAPF